jgi:FlaG/FlaF family flagellin (archaellin)
MLAVTVVLCALVGAFAFGLGGMTENAPEAAISARIEPGTSGNPKIVLVHRGGDAIDVRDITVRVFVDGQPLQYQPNVPFYSEKGFDGFPDGPFNSNTVNKIWTAGEDASLTIAGTNSPQPSAGSRVVVRIYAHGEAVATARV